MISQGNLEIIVMITGWVFLAVVTAYTVLFFRVTSWIRENTKEDGSVQSFNSIFARKRVLTATQILVPSRLPELILNAKRKELYLLRLLLISTAFLLFIIIFLGIIQKRLVS